MHFLDASFGGEILHRDGFKGNHLKLEISIRDSRILFPSQVLEIETDVHTN